VQSITTRHTIRNRLLASMAATVVIAIVMTAIVFVVGAVTIRTLDRATGDLDAMNEAAYRLQTALFSQESFVFDYALSGRIDAVEEFEAASVTEADAYADLRAMAADLPPILSSVSAAHDAAAAWREEWAEPFLRSGAGAGIAGGRAAVSDSETLFRPAEASLAELFDALAVQRSATAAEINSAIPNLAAAIIPVGLATTVLLGLVGVWHTRTISGPLGRLSGTARALVAGDPVTFRPERDDELGALAVVLEQLRVDAGARYDHARLEGEHAGIFNQLAELTSFARDESDLVEAAGMAVRRLVPTTRGDILLANPSQNRLTVGVAWGDSAPAAGSLVNLDKIDRCPGIRRSSAFVSQDRSDAMAVGCAAHPAASGTVACVPMLALGKIVGVIHLESDTVNAFDSDHIRLVSRVAEGIGLAMANARLMETMAGQAMTDPLTGLRNTRFFDPYLEQELAAASRDEQPLSVLMIDIDQFKAFNDAYGHPAGDEALRSFARVLSSSIRASDVAARYGGEEFIVALRHVAIDEARAMAEKLRASIEQMVVELGPGRYAKITASFGVATTGPHVPDQKSLVSLADAGLYRAKERGRNRVELAQSEDDVIVLNPAARGRSNRPGRVESTAPDSRFRSG
jgi:diguanylate cyclase (GGDEF)-like protein